MLGLSDGIPLADAQMSSDRRHRCVKYCRWQCKRSRSLGPKTNKLLELKTVRS